MALVEFILAVLACMGPARDKPSVTTLHLSSLLSGCTVEERWVGIVPALPEGVFLDCGGTTYLIRKPSNLLGHVNITNEQQALEFVRFFSSAESHDHFDMGGMVEILAGRPGSGVPFNVIERGVFARHLHEPIVKAYPVFGRAGNLPLAGTRDFEVTRYVVYPSNEVFLVHEVISSTGFYELKERRRVLTNAKSIGLEYFVPAD